MKKIAQNETGFTLIEMLLALSIFSLMLLVAYQALTSSALSKARISQAVDQQSQVRSAYRTLTNAFAARAEFNGDSHSLEFDLTVGDSPWLEGVKRINFVITDDQALWASMDINEQASRLLNRLDGAEFRYFDGELSQTSWSAKRRPTAVELSWFEQGERRRWRFESR